MADSNPPAPRKYQGLALFDVSYPKKLIKGPQQVKHVVGERYNIAFFTTGSNCASNSNGSFMP